MNTIAEVSHLNSEQYDAYLKGILEYNEAKAALDTAFDEGRAEGKAEGRAEGKAEGRIEVAREMLAENFDVATIARMTKLPLEAINELMSKS